MGSAQDSAITKRREERRPQPNSNDRRAQARVEGVLSKIEDATYAVLRKHEKKSA